MFRPIALFIGLRYTKAKRRNHFISFISLTSMLGIALGVMVLITVLSVMNGFDEEIRNRILSMARQLTITTFSNHIDDIKGLQDSLKNAPDVIYTAPFVDGQGMLVKANMVKPVIVSGILPQQEKQISELSRYMVNGQLSALKAGHFGIIIGHSLAESLGLTLGSHITLVTPVAAVTPAGLMPRFKSFKVEGIFKIGNGFGYDSNFAFMHLNDAQALFQLGHAVSGLRLKIRDLYQAPTLANELATQLPEGYLISNWTQEYGGFFSALKLEKTMMFLMLMLIVAVATFNLVSTLVMVVTDKQSDIAILRTLGATPATIMATFMVQGIIIGIIGTALGVVGGCLLSNHVTSLVQMLEHLFNVQLITSDVYYVDYLPAKLLRRDVLHVSLLAMLLSLFATLYPAWRAAQVQPAEALRYE